MSSWRVLVLALVAAGGAAAAPVRVLMITGETDLPHHDWRVTAPFLRQALEDCGRFEVKVLEEPRGLTAPTLAPYDVLLLHYNGPRWGGSSEAAVEEFIRSGKGMIAVHGVSYGRLFGMVLKGGRWVASPEGDRGWPAYAEMLGATWKPENIGHSVRHVFPVKWTDPQHPIARGLPVEFLANDELYHRMDLRPNAHVIAAAFSDPAMKGTGREEPQIWTVAFGKGRVVHMTLGHDLAAMHQPGFLTALLRGTEWAATGAVTLGAVESAVRAPAKDALRLLVVTGAHGYPVSFYTLFEGHKDIRWEHATSLREAFRPKMAERFDVVLLHDMHQEISEAEQANLREFVESGKGIVSVHHAIASYPAWRWWREEVLGGHYFIKPADGHPASQYKEGVDFLVKPVAAMASHPVLRGVGPLPVHDELYRGMWHSPKITVLMEADHPENDRPAVYIGPHPKARVVYIQLGHSDSTMRHPGFRKLVRNAILWSARRLE